MSLIVWWQMEVLEHLTHLENKLEKVESERNSIKANFGFVFFTMKMMDTMTKNILEKSLLECTSLLETKFNMDTCEKCKYHS